MAILGGESGYAADIAQPQESKDIETVVPIAGSQNIVPKYEMTLSRK